MLTPIRIKIMPPTISILFLKKRPNRLPRYIPKKDRENVIIPVVRAGATIEAFRKDKLRPTARASILVAMDNTNNIPKLSEPMTLLASFLIDS